MATTFTTKNGTKFQVGEFHTWTAPNGVTITKAEVNTHDPKTGHGGHAWMTAAEIEMWRAR